MSTDGPYWSTVGVRQIRKDNAAVLAAPIMNFTGGITVTYVPASALNPIPRIDVALPADPTASIAALQAADVALAGRLDAVEPIAVDGGRWDLSAIFVCTTGSEALSAAIGRYHRIDASNYGPGDLLTVTLPLVDATNVGRRLRIAEISGAITVGAPNGEIKVATQGGQLIDGGAIATPYAITGDFPRRTFVAVVDAGPVYGWSLEAAS